MLDIKTMWIVKHVYFDFIQDTNTSNAMLLLKLFWKRIFLTYFSLEITQKCHFLKIISLM